MTRASSRGGGHRPRACGGAGADCRDTSTVAPRVGARSDKPAGFDISKLFGYFISMP